jgi:hypothetical protein
VSPYDFEAEPTCRLRLRLTARISKLAQLPQFTPKDFFSGLETLDFVRPSRHQLAKVDVVKTKLVCELW